MKLLTLNLHLWAEDDQINKLKRIAKFIEENDVDVCFFQEVAQLELNEIIIDNIRKDNNAYLIKTYLNKDEVEGNIEFDKDRYEYVVNVLYDVDKIKIYPTASSEKSKIKIELNNGELSFFNDGKPIDEQFINQGFKPYEKGSEGKFGLGMSIVCRTLEIFNMKLDVKNVKDGVLFTIKKK